MSLQKSDSNILLRFFDGIMDTSSAVIYNVLSDNYIIKNHIDEINKITISTRQEGILQPYYEKLTIPMNQLYIRNQLIKYSFTGLFTRERRDKESKYYKLYLFINLPYNLYVKLFRQTNDFNRWTSRTYESFTLLLDLYANGIIYDNEEETITNLSPPILQFYNFRTGISIDNMELLDSYKKLKKHYYLIVDNILPLDLKEILHHNELFKGRGSSPL